MYIAKVVELRQGKTTYFLIYIRSDPRSSLKSYALRIPLYNNINLPLLKYHSSCPYSQLFPTLPTLTPTPHSNQTIPHLPSLHPPFHPFPFLPIPSQPFQPFNLYHSIPPNPFHFYHPFLSKPSIHIIPSFSSLPIHLFHTFLSKLISLPIPPFHPFLSPFFIPSYPSFSTPPIHTFHLFLSNPSIPIHTFHPVYPTLLFIFILVIPFFPYFSSLPI